MDYGLKESILYLDKSSYAKEHDLPRDISTYLNCSSGINPFGVSKDVENCLSNIPLDIVNIYPESSLDLRKTIVKHWSDISKLSTDQILLGGGSIELIYKINKLFLDGQSKVLGYSPQFSDYIDDVKACGNIYECYLMNEDNNFKFVPEQYISRMNKNYKLFYIDNPNNPTGQIINIDTIEQIAKKAKNLDLPVVIDEAYGDFIDSSNSAISIVNKYDNLMIMRTFSKGFGLAGIRAGYLITSKQISEQYIKISNPYEIDGIARKLAIVAMNDKKFMNECNNVLKSYKKKFIDSLSKFTVLETDLSVPIMTIVYPDSNVDLQELLLKHHVLSVGGQCFIGLNQNSVRLMMTDDIDSLISIFKEIESEI